LEIPFLETRILEENPFLENPSLLEIDPVLENVNDHVLEKENDDHDDLGFYCGFCYVDDLQSWH
jgi:hypothetical protein